MRSSIFHALTWQCSVTFSPKIVKLTHSWKHFLLGYPADGPKNVRLETNLPQYFITQTLRGDDIRATVTVTVREVYKIDRDSVISLLIIYLFVCVFRELYLHGSLTGCMYDTLDRFASCLFWVCTLMCVGQQVTHVNILQFTFMIYFYMIRLFMIFWHKQK